MKYILQEDNLTVFSYRLQVFYKYYSVLNIFYFLSYFWFSKCHWLLTQRSYFLLPQLGTNQKRETLWQK